MVFGFRVETSVGTVASVPSPLAHRVPVGPPVFLGRERETQALLARTAEDPLVVLVGAGGLGKTALAVHALRSAIGRAIDEAVYVAVEPDEPGMQLRYAILHALARKAGDWAPERQVDDRPEAVVAAAVEIAETSRAWVIIDDIHNVAAGELDRLLAQIASRARESRFIATSRVQVASHQLELPPMADADMAELGRALAPDTEAGALRRAVRAARGSPWLLAQWAVVGERGLALTREDLLASVDFDCADLLSALSVLRGPFSEKALGTFVEMPDEARIDVLVRRGLVERHPPGLVVHDIVRELLFAGRKRAPEERAWMARAAEGFVSTGDDEPLLESMRLLALLGRIDDVRALMAAHGDRLLANGYAVGLWAIVEYLADPTLKGFRARCISALRTPATATEVSAPIAIDAHDKLMSANALYAQGDLTAACLEAYDAARSAASLGDVGITASGLLLSARCHSGQGSPERAETTLASIEHAPGLLRVRVDAAKALSRALRGEHADAERVLATVRGAPDGETDEAAQDLAEAFYVLGRPDTADELLDRVLTTQRSRRVSAVRAQQASAMRARILVDRGELEEATALVTALRPAARPSSVLRPEVLELDARIDLVEGRFDGLIERLEAVLAASEGVDAGCALRARCMAIELALLSGVRPVTDAPVATSRIETIDVALWRRIATAHAGNFVVGDDLDHEHPRHRVLAELVRSTDALVAHRPSDAAGFAEEGVRLARKHSLRVLEATLLRAEGDALAAAGRTGELEATSAFLREAASHIRSKRFGLEAELWLAADNPATLEHIANALDTSPAAARRARALLGSSVALDEVDRLVVSALEGLRGGLKLSTVCTDRREWAVGWGIDERDKTVWLPEGRKIDLAKKGPLWDLLTAVADLGGRASTDALVARGWSERDLPVTARKIRDLIEDDPAVPRRMITDDGQYRLGGTVRRLVTS